MATEPGPVNIELAQPFLDTVSKEDPETIDILTQKCKSKPYFSIMRILLFIWPKERKEYVIKELKLLRNLKIKAEHSEVAMSYCDLELSTYTTLLWDNLNVGTYYQYINRHKSYVRQSYNWFNKLVLGQVKSRLYSDGLLLECYIPDKDPTDDQIEVHDESKYSFVETVTYAMRWYPCQGLGKCDEDSWESGLDHHYCHNEHHPEFWGTKPMHWCFIVEAMYDMAAMELEKRFNGQEPVDKAKLLDFEQQFLKRFERTGQLEFIQKLIRYTKEAYESFEHKQSAT